MQMYVLHCPLTLSNGVMVHARVSLAEGIDPAHNVSLI
jgi:hypothetical protein